jgi:hypothetical protein
LGRKRLHDYVCVALTELIIKVEGHGSFEDEVLNVGGGQTQNMQQSFG